MVKRKTMREMATDRNDWYYKLKKTYERACPHCDTFLRIWSDGIGYDCECGHWSYDYVEGKLIYEPNREEKKL